MAPHEKWKQSKYWKSLPNNYKDV
ncbi:uncharacterized protein G2W53_005388 [Senna tora]|uniref:Uncharacterized protein n=1 Tax=Senna tora TaxID=362788 RepID=A0A835CK67_9FABA|nr:uncharacterized protein G2W53_005388 [Senna tora]